MSQAARNDQPENEPTCFEIHIKETLDPRWAACFEGMTLTTTDSGQTILHLSDIDKAALHGILAWIGEHNLTLISVVPCQKTEGVTHG